MINHRKQIQLFRRVHRVRRIARKRALRRCGRQGILVQIFRAALPRHGERVRRRPHRNHDKIKHFIAAPGIAVHNRRRRVEQRRRGRHAVNAGIEFPARPKGGLFHVVDIQIHPPQAHGADRIRRRSRCRTFGDAGGCGAAVIGKIQRLLFQERIAL